MEEKGLIKRWVFPGDERKLPNDEELYMEFLDTTHIYYCSLRRKWKHLVMWNYKNATDGVRKKFKKFVFTEDQQRLLEEEAYSPSSKEVSDFAQGIAGILERKNSKVKGKKGRTKETVELTQNARRFLVSFHVCNRSMNDKGMKEKVKEFFSKEEAKVVNRSLVIMEKSIESSRGNTRGERSESIWYELFHFASSKAWLQCFACYVSGFGDEFHLMTQDTMKKTGLVIRPRKKSDELPVLQKKSVTTILEDSSEEEDEEMEHENNAVLIEKKTINTVSSNLSEKRKERIGAVKKKKKEALLKLKQERESVFAETPEEEDEATSNEKRPSVTKMKTKSSVPDKFSEKGKKQIEAAMNGEKDGSFKPTQKIKSPFADTSDEEEESRSVEEAEKATVSSKKEGTAFEVNEEVSVSDNGDSNPETETSDVSELRISGGKARNDKEKSEEDIISAKATNSEE